MELSRGRPRRRVQALVTTHPRPLRVTVCWKWVAVDGASADERWAGVSAADEAALEIGLRLAGLGDGGANRGEVTVVCVGPAGADSVLRDALAAGASTAVRIDATDAASRDVAAAIALVAHDSDVVVCGDYSLDRGTGSVPAYLAADLNVAQALGLVDIDTGSSPLRVVRRLDGGRREVLDVPTPAVISVEGSLTRLRRASLAATLQAKAMPITVVKGPTTLRPRRHDQRLPTAFALTSRASGEHVVEGP